jgi:hypothetical protein
MRDTLFRWFAIPAGQKPADVLRWVRRIQLATAAVGCWVAVLAWANGVPKWWLVAGLAVVLPLVGALSLAPAIRRAEHRPPPDPARAGSRERVARRWTIATFVVIAVIALPFEYLAAGWGFVIFMQIVWAISLPFGLYLRRRWPRISDPRPPAEPPPGG